MKKEAALGLSLALVLFSASALAGAPRPAPRQSSDKLLATYYFYWYDIYTNLHFLDPDGSDALTHHPPDGDLATFSYTEVSWHRDQLLDLMAAGVDVVLPIYWGDDTNLYWSQSGLRNLVTAGQALIGQGRTPPRIGMSYDTTALEYQNGHVPPDLTTPAGKSLFYGMIADFFSLVPRSLWATVDGRPIIVLYVSQFVSAYNQSTFDYAIQRFQADFSATPFFVRESSWQNVATDGVYTWGVALNGPGTWGDVGSLGPGYDESAVYGRPNPRIRARECGEFYKDGWEAIFSADPSFVLLETWNEFHEGTDVAASREFGTAYISLTAENAARWKALDGAAAPLVWLDLGEHPLQRGLRPALVSGDGVWAAATVGGHGAAHPVNTSAPPSYYLYLDVADAFIHAAASEVWVTVEYYDGGTDRWQLEYDGAAGAYTAVTAVSLQNTGQWRRSTFHLTDAYFGGRQNGGADLRLSDAAWQDGQTNHFGRIWISKSAGSNQPPVLTSPHLAGANVGQTTEIPVRATDADGQAMTLSLDRAPSFATLAPSGAGSATLRLAPTAADVRECAVFVVRILAAESGASGLADAETVMVTIPAPQCALTLQTATGGSTNPAPGTTIYPAGASVTVSAVPSSGYSFSGWTGDVPAEQKNTNPLTFYVEADLTVKANFKKDSGGGGDDDGGGGGCFIATACYGTAMAGEVKVLSAFRDRYLLADPRGRAFVELYYALSPPLADRIRDKEGIKALVREFLSPIVLAMKWLVVPDRPGSH
jgi:uncharacterized repeat protein (TIGR02543 family)